MSAGLISVIGPPAVGKTTLAEHLARELPAALIREDFAGNPFLAESYAGSEDARLPSQLYFLISRVGQLSTLAWPQDGLFVSDYGFCQDAIFARARLSASDLAAYESVLQRLAPRVHAPDVLVALDACEQTLLQRIADRGREFERVMDRAFLSAMRRAYNEAAAEMTCPVLRVDCDAADIGDASVRAELIGRIRETL